MLRIFATSFAGLLGLAFGSFLNVCLSRWPAGESVVQPRSHCRSCDHVLAWWENVPVLSWLLLRGRCRGCGAWIGWRYPLVEAAVGGLWAAVGWRFAGALADLPDYLADASFMAFGFALFYFVLVGLAVLDAAHFWLPDAVTMPGIGAGLLVAFAHEKLGRHFDIGARPLHALIQGIVSAAFAGGLILLIRWIYWLIRRREGIGLGDVKLMAMLGAWLGLPQALLAFCLGVVLGAVVAAVALLLPNGEKWGLRKLPLGTFLCVGGIVSSLWGAWLLDVYFRWAGF